jgi:hypothetical protein
LETLERAMALETNNELADFHVFLGERLKNGGTHLSPEEALDEWRMLRPERDDLQASVAAVQRALEQAERGEGLSLEEFDRQFRQRHNLPIP